MLAAHVLLLIQAPLPDTLLSSLLSSSYPTLLLHARRVLEIAVPSAHILPPERYSLTALIPYPSFRACWIGPRTQKSDEEKRFDRMRWQWIGLAIVGSVGYWAIWGPTLRLVRMDDDDEVENLAFIIEDEAGDEGADEDDEDDGVDEPEDGDGDEGDGQAEAS